MGLRDRCKDPIPRLFTFETRDLTSYPLLSWDLLEMQWHLRRIAACSIQLSS